MKKHSINVDALIEAVMNEVEKDTVVTEVIFGRWNEEEGGDVIAFFPYLFDDYKGQLVTSYMTVGQHSGADLDGLFQSKKVLPVSSSDPDVEDLISELESIGYNLKVITKVDQDKQDEVREKYIQDLRAELKKDSSGMPWTPNARKDAEKLMGEACGSKRKKPLAKKRLSMIGKKKEK